MPLPLGSCQQQPMAGWLARCPASPPSLGGMRHRAQQKVSMSTLHCRRDAWRLFAMAKPLLRCLA
ncbi:hypothetical protein [Paenibacillus xylanilyticus]|uniref:hypothetical protein n=1 Tax=Paenibacillus xylanilyticus TaxID=248903 RepID=UPI003AAB44AA